MEKHKCVWGRKLGFGRTAGGGGMPCCSVAKSYLVLCNPVDCSPPGLAASHYFLEFAQDCVRWVGDAIQPSQHLPPSSPLPSIPPSIRVFSSESSVSGGQSIGASASASVLPLSIQGWFLLGLTGLISLQSKGLWRIFSCISVQKHQFLGTFLYKKWSPIKKVIFEQRAEGGGDGRWRCLGEEHRRKRGQAAQGLWAGSAGLVQGRPRRLGRLLRVVAWDPEAQEWQIGACRLPGAGWLLWEKGRPFGEFWTGDDMIWVYVFTGSLWLPKRKQWENSQGAFGDNPGERNGSAWPEVAGEWGELGVFWRQGQHDRIGK